ncbi:MAG: 3-hydroxylacyl-ACP dehydratase [Steroidobacteraceae bacterium]
MRLDQRWIAAHIPHQGRMCLLEEVLSWDEQQLLCRAGSHRAIDHPLRAHGRLGSACAIEYAAQAAAVHGALLQPRAPARADAAAAASMLASARAVELAVRRLDDIRGDLLISAVRLQHDARGALYAFALQEQPGEAAGAGRQLAHGRLSLWLAVSVP